MSISAQFDAGLWQDNFGDLSAPEQRDLLCAASWDLCRLLQQLRDGTVASQQAACHALISVTGNLGYLHCAHALRRIDQRWIAGDVMTGAHLRHAVDALCQIAGHLEQRISLLTPQLGGRGRPGGAEARPS